jgi:hypothetical protein
VEGPTTYHEEGWLYDLSQVRGATLALLLGVAGFAATLAVASSHHGSGGDVDCTYYGACSNALSAYGFLLSAFTLVSSAIGVLVGGYTASQNTHRVRKIAWVYAVLCAANLVAFTTYLVILSI